MRFVVEWSSALSRTRAPRDPAGSFTSTPPARPHQSEPRHRRLRHVLSWRGVRKVSRRGVDGLIGPERPKFEPSEPGHRVFSGDRDRLVEILAFEDVEACDPLPCLGERPVGHEELAVAAASATEYGSACMGALVGMGILLMLVGFALVAPRGAGSGSVSHRNIRIAPTAISTTRGYGHEPSKRARIGIRLVGLAMLVGGLLMIALASK